MRIVYAGTPPFSAAALSALAAAGHEIVLVLTQPDRPAGRGMKLTPSAVKQSALALGLPVYQPQTLRNADSVEKLKAAGAEVMVVAAYGLILPPEVLNLFPAGCINIHASLLPRWRGASPIQAAVLAGDAETGISIMQLEAGLDTGPVFASARLAIGADETAGELEARLARLGADTLGTLLADLLGGRLRPVAQPDAGVTYARRISKAEARIDWREPAVAIGRRVRAWNPWPVAETLLDGQQLRCFASEPLGEDPPGAGRVPGQVLACDARGIEVQTGEGRLRLRTVQAPGRQQVAAADFARGRSLVGKVLG